MKSDICWKCGGDLGLPEGPLSFRATCDHCGSWVHCCLGCQNYAPGKPNDCAIPGTDFIVDREAANLCDEFKMLGIARERGRSVSGAEERLFGEAAEKVEDECDPSKRFNDLFSDD